MGMKILIIATGGTISHEPNEKGILESNEKSHGGGDFVRILNFKKTKLGIDSIESKTILNKDSGNMVMDDWKTIVGEIVANYDDYDAFIVTHGTETMGYATSAVSFALGNLGKPVCFTGSQSAFGVVGSDTVINLDNSLRVLSARRDLVGVFLVFGTQVVSGTRVKKDSEFSYDAFKSSRRFRPLGVVGSSLEFNEEEVSRHLGYLKPYAKTRKDLDVKCDFSNNLVVLSEFPGLQAEMIINIAKSGVKGFILRSYGSGVPNITKKGLGIADLRHAFEYLKDKKIPLVITSQASSGVACMSIYEPSLLALELGAIPAHDMNIESTVAKLSWLLGQCKNQKEIKDAFAKSLRGEIYK